MIAQRDLVRLRERQCLRAGLIGEHPARPKRKRRGEKKML
jgi:hypothetical protein